MALVLLGGVVIKYSVYLAKMIMPDIMVEMPFLANFTQLFKVLLFCHG